MRQGLLLPVFMTLLLALAACSDVSTNPDATEAVPTTALPTTVTIAGSFQSELGCPGDWQPDCSLTGLTYDAVDDVWQGIFTIPAGSYEYKVALNDSWDENYGRYAIENGPNIPILSEASMVKFYYDHKTHWVTSNRNAVIVTAAGSFQSELGCPGDWQPDCLRSWLQDPEEDGVYTFRTSLLPAGNYEVKAALWESWDENYGLGGVPNGANIPFTVPAFDAEVVFTYVAATNVLTVTVVPDDASPPDTVITSAPPAVSYSSSASFTFTGSDDVTPAAELSFECQLNGAGFVPCTSPQVYNNLTDGLHAFLVRAMDEAGNVDPSPAGYVWTVNTTVTAPAITTAAELGTLHLFRAVDVQLQATGGVAPYTWHSPDLHLMVRSLSLSADGRIIGRPLQRYPSPRTFTVYVTDANGNTVSKELSLMIR